MRINKILLYLVLLIGVSVKAFSQNLTLKVLDDITSKPIVDCHLALSNGAVIISNIEGIITITPETKSITGKLTHVAYKEHYVNISLLPADTVSVRLMPSNILLPEYTLLGKEQRKRYVKMGIKRKRPIKRHPGYTVNGISAQFITNEKPEDDYKIEGVYVYIKENSRPETQFLVSIYEGESVEKEPNKKLKLYGPVLCQTDMVGDHYKISVENENITMPKNGLFIVFEGSPSRNLESETVRKSEQFCYADFVRIGYSSENPQQFLTWHFKKGQWKRFIFPKINARGHNNYVNNPMVYVNLEKINK
ncbi:MAG: hypothetical protein PHU66_05765 [Bacteroidaceae bacterium]|nr:hypothetical protein [Bacteroidaceae bacterium]